MGKGVVAWAKGVVFKGVVAGVKRAVAWAKGVVFKGEVAGVKG